MLQLTASGVGQDSNVPSSVTPSSSPDAGAITPNLEDGVGGGRGLVGSAGTLTETTSEPDAVRSSGTAGGSAVTEGKGGPREAGRVCFFDRLEQKWETALEKDHQNAEPFELCPCESCRSQAKIDANYSIASTTGLILYIRSLQSEIKTLEEKINKTGEKEKEEVGVEEEKEDAEGGGWKVSIAWKRRTSEKYGGVIVTDESDPDFADPYSKSSTLGNDSILYVYRDFHVETYGQSPLYHKTTLEIRSPILIALLREVVQYYPANSLMGDTVSFTNPYKALFHHRKVLVAFAKDETSDPETKRHVDLLLEFLQKNDPVTSKELDRFENGDMQLRQTCPFKSLWIVYPPGSFVVYKDEYGHYQLYVVYSVSGQEEVVNSNGHIYRRPLFIKVWHISYTGSSFERIFNWLQVGYYEGAVDCSSLEFTPIAYFPESDDLLAKLETRGMKYWSFQGSQFREYARSISDPGIYEAENMRVMIDYEMWRRMNPTSPLDASPPSRILNDPPEEYNPNTYYGQKIHEYDIDPNPVYRKYRSLDGKEAPDRLAKLLCPPRVWGYSLPTKKWELFAIDKLGKVAFRKDSFQKVVLNERHKEIVKAMVGNHVSRGSQFQDLVTGKGQGLVVLLHGPPGVGKTLTAECIADMYERPLLSVTCGDFGITPDVLESRLSDTLLLAEKWGAVLLLDEADVFLASRDYDNVNRNALVSIFLRTLEYFNGVMFLTTNRVGIFDEAFQSRIHITLGLPPLNQDNRLQIWYNFIRELKDVPKRDQKRFAQAAKTDWCKLNFNGRQIRNCVKAALVIARREDRMVDIQDFKDVMEVGVQFAQYVRKLRKMEAERLAESGGLRLDMSSNSTRDPGRSGATSNARSKSRRDAEFDSHDENDDDLSDF